MTTCDFRYDYGFEYYYDAENNLISYGTKCSKCKRERDFNKLEIGEDIDNVIYYS